MARAPHILVGISQMLLRAAVLAGVDRAEVLREAGLSEMDLADRDARLPLDRHLALGHAILSRRPAVPIGLAIGEAVSPSSLGVLGAVAQHSATLGEALLACARYAHFMAEALRVPVERDAGGLTLHVHGPAELEALKHPIEGIFATWVGLGRAITGARFAPREVAIPHRALGDPRAYEAFFGCEVRFRAERASLRIDHRTAALPIPNAMAGRRQLHLAHLGALLAELQEQGGEGEASAALRAELLEALTRGEPRRSEVAARLGMSERTLSRRLRSEGKSYGEILGEVRFELAERYLRDRELAVYEVAFLLGYSEPSTFHRAFKRRTGMTPQSFRAGA